MARRKYFEKIIFFNPVRNITKKKKNEMIHETNFEELFFITLMMMM